MKNIESEWNSFKSLLNGQSANDLYAELITKVNKEDGYFSPGNTLNTLHTRNIHTTRYNISKGDAEITGMKDTLEKLADYSQPELILHSLTFSDSTYSLFISFDKNEILGVIKSKYLNSDKLKNLNETYKERKYEVDSFPISKGELV